MEVNQMNGEGLTALDIFYDRQDSLNPEVGEILRGAKAKKASELAAFPLLISILLSVGNSPVTYFSEKLSFGKNFLKSLGLVDHSINKKVPLEVRNVLTCGGYIDYHNHLSSCTQPPWRILAG
ncbi:hypothetical protein Pint_16687 [Pistacia integerrima]|uniref:Uncharacterized protein n=1 Tax=Pistacia integerrima TaxID=434235 RepID=A0ACC0ZCJ4_9ROSI|nr:hypothetical protein Pint_16687 [Pistacia integerrima]